MQITTNRSKKFLFLSPCSLHWHLHVNAKKNALRLLRRLISKCSSRHSSRPRDRQISWQHIYGAMSGVHVPLAGPIAFTVIAPVALLAGGIAMLVEGTKIKKQRVKTAQGQALVWNEGDEIREKDIIQAQVASSKIVRARKRHCERRYPNRYQTPPVEAALEQEAAQA